MVGRNRLHHVIAAVMAKVVAVTMTMSAAASAVAVIMAIEVAVAVVVTVTVLPMSIRTTLPHVPSTIHGRVLW